MRIEDTDTIYDRANIWASTHIDEIKSILPFNPMVAKKAFQNCFMAMP